MTLRHLDVTSGFGDVPILCPFLEFLLLGSQFASRVGPCEQDSSHERSIFAIAIALAISQSCVDYGVWCIAVPCFWTMTRSDMPNACFLLYSSLKLYFWARVCVKFDLTWSAKLQVDRAVISIWSIPLGGHELSFFATLGLRKDFYWSFRPLRLVFKYVFSPFRLILCTYLDRFG